MGTSVSGRSCFALILATLSVIITQCPHKGSEWMEWRMVLFLVAALAPISLQALAYRKESH